MSTKYMRMSVAANQDGKSYDRAIEAVIMMTGELPYSLRVPAGVDTGVVRTLSRANIIRWGRRDKTSKKILDHNWEATKDGTWDCGNIIGVGVYPIQKICKERGQQVWICTYKQARDDVWVELFQKLIPEHCLDKKQGTDGYSKSEFIFYLLDGRSIRLKTYDQGWERVEAFKAWHIILDEEPPDRKYYTGCVLHAYTLSFSFTPLRGMSWVYTDLYESWKNGSQDIDIFQATKYDSPYAIVSEVERQERLLKGWEREPKIYGRFAAQEGKPYYDWEFCKKYISDYIPNHKLATIFPRETCRRVDEAVRSRMNVKVLQERGTETGVWEIYEDPIPGEAYWMTADCGRGSDDPEQAQDFSVSYIFRRPRHDKSENPEWPICVACLRSSELTENFAWLSLYGAILYNCASIIVETKGEDGSAYFVELREYPFWFKMTLVNDKSKKTTERIGFDTNARTRTPLFNKLRKYINAHEEKSHIPHYDLLIEMSKIVWRKGRPDHPEGGTSDCTVSYCLGLWMWEEAPYQIHDNSKRVKERFDDVDYSNFLLTEKQKRETKPVLGTSRGMDTRRRESLCQQNGNNHQSPRNHPRVTGQLPIQTLKRSGIF